MEKKSDNFAAALDAHAKGYTCIPILAGTKVPAVKWKPFQTERPSLELLHQWFRGTRTNIAILTTGLVVFDCDEFGKAELVLEHCGDTPHKLKTPRGGIHLAYRARQGVTVGNRVRIKGMPIDIRAENGLEIIPHSETEDGRYEWLGEGLKPKSELPVAKIGWTRTYTRRTLRKVVVDDADSACRRARAYLACIEGAIAGQRGHDKTMRVAGVLIQKFGLTIERALPLFIEWSETSCEPPWTEKELLHKLQDAERNLGTSKSLYSLKGGP